MWEQIDFWGQWHAAEIKTAIWVFWEIIIFLLVILFLAGPPGGDDDNPAAA
ncbi:hypothetical protein BAJUN_03020 [Bajunvirus bajun]|uniref:Uncharacterized protein n=1 Tax=Brevundimonas phage vB_BgoS-Bajun TaxID=2948594 RepID=A0A9E7N716_9CAUD|nr:hypothetical protein BAJUN_03020 [Brevundimonas phage vB_BgoS-Bajun]